MANARFTDYQATRRAVDFNPFFALFWLFFPKTCLFQKSYPRLPGISGFGAPLQPTPQILTPAYLAFQDYGYQIPDFHPRLPGISGFRVTEVRIRVGVHNLRGLGDIGSVWGSTFLSIIYIYISPTTGFSENKSETCKKGPKTTALRVAWNRKPGIRHTPRTPFI